MRSDPKAYLLISTVGLAAVWLYLREGKALPDGAYYLAGPVDAEPPPRAALGDCFVVTGDRLLFPAWAKESRADGLTGEEFVFSARGKNELFLSTGDGNETLLSLEKPDRQTAVVGGFRYERGPQSAQFDVFMEKALERREAGDLDGARQQYLHTANLAGFAGNPVAKRRLLKVQSDMAAHMGPLEAGVNRMVVPVVGAVSQVGAQGIAGTMRGIDQGAARQEEAFNGLFGP